MDKLFETSNFIHDEIDRDLEKHPDMTIHTRFPPEPSGYFHIGHVKAISLNFSTALKYGGLCNLRMDDTNPILEKKEYVEAIQRDIKWLGFTWNERVFYASEYFDQCFEYALKLIDDGDAFVCDLNADELREYRGTLTEPGRNSPYRDRSPEENRRLFLEMRDGKYEDGTRTLRAKIDMGSGNINMRDPVIYRIMHKEHSHTGNRWCIYPMYDFAHPIQDAIEGITHSLCDVGFEDHRPLYEWVLEKTGYGEFPKQREFARLNITHTITSKRKLRDIVEAGVLSGWDDPRMPTIAGLRRRGYTPSSLLSFIDKVGVAKTYSVVDMALLEFCIRDELNKSSRRVMAVLDPVELVISNYDESCEYLEVENNPEDSESGSRLVPFTRKLYIEREDFMVDPPRKYFRLSPGTEVRLKNAYFVKCTDFEQDENGNVTRIICTYDPQSKGGNSPDGRKVKGTLHWVSTEHAVDAEIRLYDRLTKYATPSDYPEGASAPELVNPDSLQVIKHAKLEPSLGDALPGDRFQFMRTGYFCCDSDTGNGYTVFNRIVSLRDTWAKISDKDGNQ
ncbi:MAG TPA: glutamine--tRNA ligase/YqeY domain fusion protein [Clostridia bacterium]|nr:glutamine--tRNA ligase/YqeY domain fusion protein [Clostridia bacterium]